ncbi:MAG: hypothetical protein RLY93_01745 [Sumerlaeia bacterium]
MTSLPGARAHEIYEFEPTEFEVHSAREEFRTDYLKFCKTNQISPDAPISAARFLSLEDIVGFVSISLKGSRKECEPFLKALMKLARDRGYRLSDPQEGDLLPLDDSALARLG